MRTRFHLCLALFLATAPLCASAQSSPATPEVKTEKHFYRLEFRLEQADANGKITNTRSYSAITGTYDKSPTHTIRTGDKVAVSNGREGEYRYENSGVSIDFEDPVEQGNALMVPVSVQVNGVIPTEPSAAGDSSDRQLPVQPIIRQNTWRALVKVPLKKPTVIFSSDNLGNRGKTQLELTATPIE